MLLKRQKASLERLTFADLIPVCGYDEKTGIFALVHDDGKSKNSGYDLAASWFGVPTPAVTDQAISDIEEFFLLDYPPGTTIQIQRTATNAVDYTVQQYKDHKRTGLLYQTQNGLTNEQKNLLSKHVKNRAEFLLSGKQQPLIKNTSHRLKEEILFISIRINNSKEPGPDGYRKAKILFDRAQAQLEKIGLNPKRMEPQSYLDVVGTILRMGETENRIVYDPSQMIRDQVTHSEDYLRTEKEYVEVNGRFVRSMSAHTFPQEHHLANMLGLFGDIMGSSRQLGDPYIATLNVIIPDYVAARDKLAQQREWVRNFNRGQIGKLSAQIRYLAEQHEKMEESLGSEGVIVRAWFNFMTFSKNEKDAEDSSQNFKTLARSFGWDFRADDRLHGQAFIAAIPMAADSRLENSWIRHQTKAVSHVAHLVPLVGEWPGNCDAPTQLYITRRGCLQSINTWASSQGYNMAIVATTGSGKSVAIQDLALNNLAAGVKVNLLDKGRSFQRTVELFGGQFFDFIEPGTYNMNPFLQVQNIDEETDQLSIIFQTMADPSASLDNFQKPVLTKILREGYAEHGHACTVDWVAERCKKDGDPRIRDLGEMLGPFTSKGQHGTWFTQGQPLTFGGNNLTAIELSALDAKPTLQAVVLQMILMEMQRLMYVEDLKGSGQKTLTVIDEAADLLTLTGPAAFAERMARQARKLSGSLAVVTQLLNDFKNRIPTGQDILGNCAFKLLMQQKSQVIQELRNENWAGLSEYQTTMLETVHTASGKYSEMLFDTPNGSGVGRLVLSRADQLLYTTDPAEKVLIKRYQDAGMDVMQAIEKIIEDENRRKPSAASLADRRSAA
jgi:conjugal transfer ATP-binding protein TraC